MIRNKRNELKGFIKEQIHGPGAYGYRFVDISDYKDGKTNISQLAFIDNTTEILDAVPGSIYSTGMLFPQDGSKNINLGQESIEEDDEDLEQETEIISEEDIETNNDIIHIDQRYPMTMGFTFALGQKVLSQLKVAIRFRHYRKMENLYVQQNVGVWCTPHRDLLINFLNQYKIGILEIVDKGNDSFLVLSKNFKKNFVEIQFIKNIDKEISTAIKNKHSDKFNGTNLNLSAMLQCCYNELKKCKDIGSVDAKNLFSISQEIENNQCMIEYMRQAFSMQTSSYGLWKCESIEKEVDLSSLIPQQLNGRRIFTHNAYQCLQVFSEKKNDGAEAALGINVQFSKDSRKKNDKVFVKIQLVNISTSYENHASRYYSVYNELVNERTFFGVGMRVLNENLLPYNKGTSTDKDNYDEDEVAQFIYRGFDDYGVGHGCSVRWGNENNCRWISTEYLPECETPDVDTIPRNKEKIIRQDNQFVAAPFMNDNGALEFKHLSIFSKASDTDIQKGLLAFVKAYEEWIALKRNKYANASISQPEKNIATQELDKCDGDRKRMYNNIVNLLKPDSENMKSFRMMNGAMFMQLWHSKHVKDGDMAQFMSSDFDTAFYASANDHLFGNYPASWRPFQLAFILLNLDGILESSDKNPRNQMVDLVWFPTGGGKTEAYLGIIALTIINRRRLYKNIGGGTAAIIRYTLRLLTLQQFQRATMLIMALELMRRWGDASFGLGDEPIYIGMWVGSSSMPNSLDELVAEIENLNGRKASKIPFSTCPWCGSPISGSTTVNNGGNTFEEGRLELSCTNLDCPFEIKPLPVSLWDKEIYRQPPALLFGTVDKFAQLAHKTSSESTKRDEDTRRIFGKGNWEKGKPKEGYLPPDLIIQDELHLLAGPLGSSVALFESAIDQLCTREDGTRPKIISSTATTRNTDLQIMALFDRHVNLFPKPGPECDDSFFSFYSRTFNTADGSGEYYQSKRCYLGVLPTGRTQIWMQMRLDAIAMAHRALTESRYLEGRSIVEANSYTTEFCKMQDYYHTIISYFNSLKEIGRTESQVHTYILKEVRRIFSHILKPGNLLGPLYTYDIAKAELTGRLNGEEIKTELQRVSSKWNPQDRLNNTANMPPDFVVATNMISVGIDVSRFNTILMNSMSRNIAEYIQASSRVARDKEGLVITVHHPFKSRDLSHFEKFIEFHEKMYSYVEPISITPFTRRALDRYMGLYVATMVRHKSKFIDRTSVSNFTQNDRSALLTLLYDYFVWRHDCLQQSHARPIVKKLLTDSDLKVIKEWLEESLDEWSQFLANHPGNTKVFNNPAKNQFALYESINTYDQNIENIKWKIPQSLRSIEAGSVLKIKLW